MPLGFPGRRGPAGPSPAGCELSPGCPRTTLARAPDPPDIPTIARRRRAIPIFIAWATLTCGAWLLLLTARLANESAHAPDFPGALAPLVAAAEFLSAPGRILAYFTRVIWRWPAWRVDLAAAALGCASLILGLVAANEVRRRLAGTIPCDDRPSPTSPSRRALIVNTFSTAGAIAAGSAGVHAVMIEPRRLLTRRYRVPIKGLRRGLDGLRLAFISDTHLGPFVPAAHIQRAIDDAIALRPDLFLLGGDYVYSFPSPMPRAIDLFEPIVATGKPVLAVLGNHDWYDDARAIATHLRRIGVRVIDNARVFYDGAARTITDGSPAGAPALCIAGLGDLTVGDIKVDRALGDLPADMPRILLAHEPDTFELQELAGPRAPRIDLALCGHTHGGQVRFPFIGAPVTCSQYGQKYLGGVARGPQCPVITSRGVGMSGLPVRFGVPPEIVEVTLVRAPRPE